MKKYIKSIADTLSALLRTPASVETPLIPNVNQRPISDDYPPSHASGLNELLRPTFNYIQGQQADVAPDVVRVDWIHWPYRHLMSTYDIKVSAGLPNDRKTLPSYPKQDCECPNVDSAPNDGHHDVGATSTIQTTDVVSASPTSDARQPMSNVIVRSSQPPQWPRIGGREFKPAPKDVFLSRAGQGYDWYLRQIYVAGCPGLRILSNQTGMPIVKIGCYGDKPIHEKTGVLNKDRYAASQRVPGGWSAPDPQWNNWNIMYLEPAQGPTTGSPVSMMRRSLAVRVPRFLGYKAFDDAFDAIVQRGALWPWLGSDDAAELREEQKIVADIGCRATLSDGYPKESKELCVFRLRHGSADVDLLIQIAELVVARSLGLVD